jgi:hypothetical protein
MSLELVSLDRRLHKVIESLANDWENAKSDTDDIEYALDTVMNDYCLEFPEWSDEILNYIKEDNEKTLEAIEGPEMKTIDCTPDWKQLYKYFMHIKDTDPKQFKIMKEKMGDEEWAKFEAVGKPKLRSIDEISAHPEHYTSAAVGANHPDEVNYSHGEPYSFCSIVRGGFCHMFEIEENRTDGKRTRVRELIDFVEGY